MKKFLTIFSFCLITVQLLQYQSIQVTDSPPDWPFMMSNLNSTQISSGILYNKVAMFSSLYDYNRGKYNITHADHFMQAIIAKTFSPCPQTLTNGEIKKMLTINKVKQNFIHFQKL